jgi:hypothetical protein
VFCFSQDKRTLLGFDPLMKSNVYFCRFCDRYKKLFEWLSKFYGDPREHKKTGLAISFHGSEKPLKLNQKNKTTGLKFPVTISTMMTTTTTPATSITATTSVT